MIRKPLFAVVLGASLTLTACGELIPASPLIPDLRDIYKNLPENKIAPPIMGETAINPDGTARTARNRLAVLPQWPKNIAQPETPRSYLDRQLRASQVEQGTQTLFPGLTGQFESIVPNDITSQDRSGSSRTETPPPIASLESPFDSAFSAISPQNTPASPQEDVMINYEALTTAQRNLAVASAPQQHSVDNAVSIDMAALEAQAVCPIRRDTAQHLRDPQNYAGFNAETARFAWENEPIAAGDFASPLPPPNALEQEPFSDSAYMPKDYAPKEKAAVEETKKQVLLPSTAPDMRSAPNRLPLTPTLLRNGSKGEPVFFDFGSARISPKARAIVKRLAAQYKTYGGHFRLIGHALAAGVPDLSSARSLAIKAALKARGVEEADIEMVESNRRPESFDSLPNIEIQWRAANLSAR